MTFAAVAQGVRFAAEGAHILDVGGESTRPYSSPVESSEELRRVMPVVRDLCEQTSVPVSIDTYKADCIAFTGHAACKQVWGIYRIVADEVRSLEVAARFTTETTFLGAHLVPVEFEGRADDYIDLVCGEMLDAAAPHARWIDVFCERGAFDADQSARVLDAGRAAGLGLRLHGNQLGHGPGVQLAVDKGCASVDHCTYLSDEDIAALASSETVATFLPATDFSTRQPYPDARRVIDAGAQVLRHP